MTLSLFPLKFNLFLFYHVPPHYMRPFILFLFRSLQIYSWPVLSLIKVSLRIILQSRKSLMRFSRSWYLLNKLLLFRIGRVAQLMRNRRNTVTLIILLNNIIVWSNLSFNVNQTLQIISSFNLPELKAMLIDRVKGY